MELDSYLIKEILRHVEQRADPVYGRTPINRPVVNGYSDEQVLYHLRMCEDAGFITLADIESGLFPTDLRYLGHIELERLREIYDPD